MDIQKMVASLVPQRNLNLTGPHFTSFKLYDNPHYNDASQLDQNLPYNFLISVSHSFLGSTQSMENIGTQTEIEILKAELEFERKMRHKVESLNQVLTMEMAEERTAREEAEERVKLLESEVNFNNAEMDKLLHEIDEERKMLRIAELWREERVQIKLSEAKLLMEEKIKEIAEFICLEEAVKKAKEASPTCQINRSGRKEVENPHIKRGIKGFVEYPKTIRVQAKEERVNLESNLECQRAQLRVLLRNKGSNCFMGTQQNLVL